MVAVKGIAVIHVVDQQGALVSVRVFPLEIAGARVILSAGAHQGGIGCVAVEIDFHLAFTPPAQVVGMADDTDVGAQEAALPGKGRQDFKIFFHFRITFPPPGRMEVKGRCRVFLQGVVDVVEKLVQVGAGFVGQGDACACAEGHVQGHIEGASFGTAEKRVFKGLDFSQNGSEKITERNLYGGFVGVVPVHAQDIRTQVHGRAL
ncbi:MAG: hypothetical protein BWY09_02784 [Candidatus Hydrogenedentes bacterium ADurb.Bin179]|nr:MAG: hypothetical protein BWY09_02784 [Candidatus Hydrogenedentes bacterium ADurb.Bin179]